MSQTFLPIATSFFNFFPNLKFDWTKLDRDLFEYRIRCLGLKCAKSYEYPPRTSKPSSGRFFTVAGPRALLREMQNKPKNCTDRPKPREMRATARKLPMMVNPAIFPRYLAKSSLLLMLINRSNIFLLSDTDIQLTSETA